MMVMMMGTRALMSSACASTRAEEPVAHEVASPAHIEDVQEAQERLSTHKTPNLLDEHKELFSVPLRLVIVVLLLSAPTAERTRTTSPKPPCECHIITEPLIEVADADELKGWVGGEENVWCDPVWVLPVPLGVCAADELRQVRTPLR